MSKLKRFLSRASHQCFELQLARQIAQYDCEGLVVLNNQELSLCCRNLCPVILNDGNGLRLCWRDLGKRRRNWGHYRLSLINRLLPWCFYECATELGGDDDGEGASGTDLAFEQEVTAEQRTNSREIDRPRPVPPNFTADCAVGLMECLKNSLLLFFGDPNARILDRKGELIVTRRGERPAKRYLTP